MSFFLTKPLLEDASVSMDLGAELVFGPAVGR